MSSVSIGFKRKREEIAVSETSAPTVSMTVGLQVDELTSTICYGVNNTVVISIFGDIFNQVRSLGAIRNNILRVEGGSSTLGVGLDAFFGCNNITSINLPYVQNAANSAFTSMSNLRSINLPKLETIGTYTFDNCPLLRTLNLPSLKTVPEYGLGVGGVSVSNLTDINLPLVTGNIGYNGFVNLTSLSSVNIPLATSILDSSFLGCTNLKTIKLNMPRANINDNFLGASFGGSGINKIRLRPAPNTPPGWTIGPGQSIGGRTGVTVVADWTDYPN